LGGALGSLARYGVARAWPASPRLFWMTGVLGGFTTYSAFALESTLLGFSTTGVAYVAITLVGCIGLAWLGRFIGAALLAQA
jgi:CrcB protein